MRRRLTLSALSLLAALGPGLLHAADPAPAGEMPEVRWQPPLTLATGDAHQGPWRQNDSDFRYVDAPSVAVDETGETAVVWVDQAEKDLRFQRYDAAGRALLPEPVNVSRSPQVFSWLPRIALKPGEPRTLYVLWQEIVFSGGSHGGDILFARSTDGGRTFSEPTNLSRDQAGSGKGRVTPDFWHNGSLDLAAGPGGHVYAAWTDYEGDLWFSRSEDEGRTFSAPRRLAEGSATRAALGPSLAVGPRGTVHLAWTESGSGNGSVHLVESADRGQSFGTGSTFDPGPGHLDAPKIAADEAGTLHLVYGHSPDGLFGRYRVAYSRKQHGGEGFSAPVTLADPESGRFGSAGFPSLGLGGEGRVYVLAELSAMPGSRPSGLGFAWSADGGETFSDLRLLPGSLDPAQGINGSLQGMLVQKLGANRAGTVAVVNSTYKPGDLSRVLLYRGEAPPGE